MARSKKATAVAVETLSVVIPGGEILEFKKAGSLKDPKFLKSVLGHEFQGALVLASGSKDKADAIRSGTIAITDRHVVLSYGNGYSAPTRKYSPGYFNGDVYVRKLA